MSDVFNQAYKKIAKLLPAAQAAAGDPHNYAKRRDLARVLSDVSMDDILDVSEFPEIGTRYFKACQAMVMARNIDCLTAAAQTLRHLANDRWRRSQSHPRPARARADIHA